MIITLDERATAARPELLARRVHIGPGAKHIGDLLARSSVPDVGWIDGDPAARITDRVRSLTLLWANEQNRTPRRHGAV